jgi:aryl-alcohol dehydrogenase-like predicted oxidoreductase
VNRAANENIVAQLKVIADKKKCTVSQLALAWLLKQGDDIFPFPGTKRADYLEQNWASIELHISYEEEKEVRDFVGQVEVKGTAQPAQFAEYLYRDTVEE